jgi:transposase
VRREIVMRGGRKPSLRIARGLFAALGDPTVIAHRPGALERVAFLLVDWQAAAGDKLADTEAGGPASWTSSS